MKSPSLIESNKTETKTQKQNKKLKVSETESSEFSQPQLIEREKEREITSSMNYYKKYVSQDEPVPRGCWAACVNVEMIKWCIHSTQTTCSAPIRWANGKRAQ